MASNLNIKYGNKNSIPNPSAGNILAAKNSVGEIEIYIDTPINNAGETTERKRLDPRIFVGELADVPAPSSLPSGATASQIAAAKEDLIRDNYDVWIDTSQNNGGKATNSSDGIMSKEQVEMLEEHDSDVANLQTDMSHMLTELHKLKLQIVSSSYWNDTDDNTKYHKNSGNKIAGMLTIVLPDSAVPSGETEEDYRPVVIDNSAITTADVTQANSVAGGF